MNQQKRKLIAWSPHNPSNFVVGANDLRLFEVKFKNGFKPSSTIKFSMDQARPEEDKKTISLLSINSEVQYLKCLAWSPSSYDPNMIAAGLANGRTVLTSFSSVNRITKEFVPRHSRSCNALAWNPFYKNQLACGLDKVRGDFSTIVWDVTLGSMGDPNVGGRVDNPHSISQREDNQFNLVPQEASSTVTEPMYELANSETTLALAWVPDSPSCLAAGTGVKWLRIYDLRGDVNAPRSVVAHAKAVSGVCFDNFDSNRLATFSEDGIVKIWDLRKLVDPTLTINTSSKAIQQIDWCPTRAGVLATIFKDGSSMKIWDVKEYSADSSRNGVLITKPSKTYHSSDVISSFAWHPSNECRMLIISPNTMAETVSLNETIPLSFSPQSDICFSYGTHFVTGPVASSSPSVVSSSSSSIANPADKNDFIDISVLMRHRALQGYSANIETNKNLSQLFNDKSLQFLWNWASTINTVTRPKKSDSSPPPQAHNSSHTVSAISNYTNTNTNTNTTNTNTNTNNTNNNNNNNSNNNNNNNYTTRDFTGIYSVLFEGYVPPPPTIINWGVDPTGVSNSGTIMDKSGFFPVYKSSQRSTCLEICGWGFSSSHSLESILQKMEKEGEYERAAALAVFHLDVRRAVITLNRGSSSSALQDKEREFNLRLVAMALAGFSENQAASNHSFYNNSLWRETCGSMSSQYKHPYLSACFGFLCNDIPSVLDMSSIALKDRIAVACRYLNNEMLHNYIERIQQVSIEAGDLAGIIVTGLSPKGVDLFQRYIDRTGDVQSAGLAMGLVVPFVFKDARVLRWISSYRELLDNWQLWHERALLDIRRGSPDTAPRAQVYARCNFCNQSLSLGVLATTNRVAVRGNAPAVKHIVNSCPGCKKALPRCSLCMISLNCSLPSYDRRSSVILPPTPSMSNFPPPSPFANKTPVLTTSTSTPNLASSSVSAAASSSTSSSSSSIASPSPSLLQQSTTQSNNNKTPGTPSNPNSSSPTSIGVEGEYIGLWSTGSNSFDDWFSWCQTCRHGGHAKHLLEWFSVHTECPVTDCTCKCCSI